jgi:hypothetical protein
MKNVKRFSEFIKESKSLEYLQGLGLVDRNEAFFKSLKQIIELCPNLTDVTYPTSESGNQSTVIKMKTPEKLYQMTLWMNVKNQITDAELREYRGLRDKRMYDQMNQYLEKVANRIYGEAEVEEIKAEMEDGVKQEFKRELEDMIQNLKSIDQSSEVDLYIWGLEQMYPVRGEKTRAQLPRELKDRVLDKYDSQKAVEFLKANPEVANKIDRIQIGVRSEKQSDFAKRMSAGEYGSLD